MGRVPTIASADVGPVPPRPMSLYHGGPGQKAGGDSMKTFAGLVLGCLLLASDATSSTYYALEVRGGSRIYALDRPVQKGRVYVFHRFPDGVYMSLAVSEVEKVASETEPPPAKGGLQPGQS